MLPKSEALKIEENREMRPSGRKREKLISLQDTYKRKSR